MTEATLPVQGCCEKHSHFQDHLPDWVTFTSSDYWYTQLTIHNSTHLSLQQISTDQVIPPPTHPQLCVLEGGIHYNYTDLMC